MFVIDCKKLKTVFDEDTIYYLSKLPYLTGDEKEKFMKFIRDKKFIDEFHFLLHVKKKVKDLGPEWVRYVDILEKGLQIAKVATSHTYGFVDASFLASQYKYTIDKIEAILKEKSQYKREKMIKELKEEIEQQKVKMHAFQAMLDEIKDPDLRKKYADEIGKIIMEPAVILDNIDNLRHLSSVISYFKNRYAHYIRRAQNMGTIAYNMNTQIRKLMGYNKKFFLDRETVARNIRRIKDKEGFFKRYENLYEAYKELIRKYNDFYRLTQNITTGFYETVSTALKHLNKTGKYNFEVIEREGDKVIIQDKYTGQMFVITSDMTGDQIIREVNTFMEIFDGNGILSAGNTAIGEMNYVNFTRKEISSFIEQFLPEMKDKIETIQDLYKKIDVLTDEQLKELYERVADVEKKIPVVFVGVEGLLKSIPHRLSAELKERLDDIITDKFMSSFFITQLLSNIEFIDKYNPDFADFLMNIHYVNESVIQKISKQVEERMYSFFNTKSGEYIKKEIQENLPFYVVLEYLKKEVSSKDFYNIMEEVEKRYHELKHKGEAEPTIYNKMADFLSETLSQIKPTKDYFPQVVKTELNTIQKQFEEAQKKQSDGIGFYAYIHQKFAQHTLDELIDEIADAYAKNINLDLLGLKDKISVKDLKDRLSGYIYNIFTHQKNITSSFVKLRHSFEHIDKAISDELGMKVGTLFREQLMLVTDNEKVVNRILGDLHGDSLYGPDWWRTVFGKMRNFTYRIKMTAFGGKGISIAMQNFISNTVEGISLFGHYEDTYPRLFSALKKLGDNDPIVQKLNRIFRASENEISKYADEQQQDFLTRFRIRFIKKYYDILYKLTSHKKIADIKKDIREGNLEKYGVFAYPFLKYKRGEIGEDRLNEIIAYMLEKEQVKEMVNAIRERGAGVLAFITNPAGIADDIASDIFIKDGIYNKIIHEKGISIDEIETLVEQIKKGDIEARKKLDKLITQVQQDVLKEFNTFYKIAYATGLTRNVFSRWVLINHFAAWGSKKFADYFYHIFLNPIRTAVSVMRHTGSIKDGIEAGIVSLITDQKFQAFLRQLWLLQVVIYNLEKRDEVDIKPEKFVKEAVIPMQAVNTFILTRVLKDAIEGAQLAKEYGMNFALGIGLGISTFARNLLAEPRFVLSLPALLAQDMYNKGIEVERLLELSKMWFFNKMNSPFLYTLFDYYRGEFKPTFDYKSDVHILEAFTLLPLTKYQDEKWHLVRLSRLASLLKKEDNWIQDLALELGLYSAELQQFEANRLSEKLSKDKRLKELQRRLELWTDDPEVVEKLWNKAMEAGLLHGWNPDKEGDFVQNDLLALALDEIKRKYGEDKVEEVLNEIRYGIRKRDEARLAKIMLLLDSKAKSAALFSYLLNQEYKEREKAYKKQLNLKSLPPELKQEIKMEVLKLGLPVLAMLDKHFHATALGLYVQDQYKDEVDWYKSNGQLRDSIRKTLQLKFFSQVISLGEANFDTLAFTSAPVQYARDIITKLPREKQIEAFNKVFDMISEWVPDEYSKIVVQAAMLYANKRLISELLSSYPEKYQGAAEKLGEIIWDTNDKIDQFTLEILGGPRGTKGQRLAKGDSLSDEQRKLGKKVKEGIRKLAKDILKNPKLKERYIKRIYNKIDFNIKPFKYEPSVEYPRFKYEKPRDIQSKILEVKRKYLKSKKARKPKTSDIKKAIRQAKSN